MKRYLILGACVLIQICLGGVYAWSAFVPALRSGYGITAGESGLIFGATIAAFTGAMMLAGWLQEAYGARLVAAIGALLFGGGGILSPYSSGRWKTCWMSTSGRMMRAGR